MCTNFNVSPSVLITMLIRAESLAWPSVCNYANMRLCSIANTFPSRDYGKTVLLVINDTCTNGKQFDSHQFKDSLDREHIKHKCNAPYAPQTNRPRVSTEFFIAQYLNNNHLSKGFFFILDGNHTNVEQSTTPAGALKKTKSQCWLKPI